MEKRVARVEPAKRGQESIAVPSKLCPNCRQELIQGRHTIAADQPVHLYPERHKRDQIGQADRAQKPTPCPKVSRRPHVFSTQPSSNSCDETAMPSDKLEHDFRNRREP